MGQQPVVPFVAEADQSAALEAQVQPEVFPVHQQDRRPACSVCFVKEGLDVVQ